MAPAPAGPSGRPVLRRPVSTMASTTPSIGPPRADRTATAWLNAEEESAWRAMLRMQAKLAAALGHDLATHGDLSLQDYAVLVTLTDRPDGRLRAYELGEELGWEKSRLSHHVARMARRGLVARERCPSDQRGLFVAVTDRGRDALRAAAPGHVETVRRVFLDPLSPAQVAALADVSRTVLDAFERSAER